MEWDAWEAGHLTGLVCPLSHTMVQNMVKSVLPPGTQDVLAFSWRPGAQSIGRWFLCSLDLKYTCQLKAKVGSSGLCTSASLSKCREVSNCPAAWQRDSFRLDVLSVPSGHVVTRAKAAWSVLEFRDASVTSVLDPVPLGIPALPLWNPLIYKPPVSVSGLLVLVAAHRRYLWYFFLKQAFLS